MTTRNPEPTWHRWGQLATGRPGHWTIPQGPNSTRSALDMVLDRLAEARAEEALTQAREAIARERRERKEDR